MLSIDEITDWEITWKISKMNEEEREIMLKLATYLLTRRGIQYDNSTSTNLTPLQSPKNTEDEQL